MAAAGASVVVLRQSRPSRSVELQIGEKRLVLNQASGKQQKQLVDEFLRSLPPTGEGS